MSIDTGNLKIGARGWQHQHWEGAYYPDDLPEEWRLSYYANDFNVVLVPVEYWDDSDGYDLTRWSEELSDDLRDDFRFYLECPTLESDAEVRRFEKQCVLIGNYLGGVLVADDFDETCLNLSCPIVQPPSLKDETLSIGLLEATDDLRAVRVWLEQFDKKTVETQKVVFVTSREKAEIPMETLMQLKTLTELMGL